MVVLGSDKRSYRDWVSETRKVGRLSRGERR
jgi:hypothetical protein